MKTEAEKAAFFGAIKREIVDTYLEQQQKSLTPKLADANLRESLVEDYLVEQVKKAGGEVRKIKYIGRNGAPDRLVALRGLHLVELKRPGKDATAGQFREHQRLRKQGASVWVIKSYSRGHSSSCCSLAPTIAATPVLCEDDTLV